MQYIKQLTFLRFLAASFIVVIHFGHRTWPFDLHGISVFLEHGAVIIGFFFFLSGTVLTLNYQTDRNFSMRSFFIKRLARVYPMYILSFLITLFLIMCFRNAYPKGYSIILQFLSLQAWVPGISLEINFPAWTISVEVFFYLLFPFLLRFFGKLKASTLAGLVISIWAISTAQHYLFSTYLKLPGEMDTGQFVLYFPIWHLNTFLFGMLCGKYILRKRNSGTGKMMLYRASYLIGTLLFIAVIYFENPLRLYLHNGSVSPLFFLIVAGLSLDRSLVTRVLGNKFFVLLGNTSYAFYIFQWPVYIVVSNVAASDLTTGGYFYAYFVLHLAISIAVYLLYEKRMRNRIVEKWAPFFLS